MLIVQNTSDALKLVMNNPPAFAQMSIMTSYREIGAIDFNPKRFVGNSNGITSVSIVPAPSAGKQHVCDFISVFNNDTAAVAFNIFLDAGGGTVALIWVGTLQAKETLHYAEGRGFYVLSATSGIEKIVQGFTFGPASNGMSMAVLATDVINSNPVANTIQDITGLSFPVLAFTTYYFRFVIFYDSATTSTGSRWSINGPTQSLLRYSSRYTATATSETVNYTSAAYDSPAAANASSLVSSNMAIIEGFITPTADGTVIGRFASEVANSAITAKAKSFVQFMAVA